MSKSEIVAEFQGREFTLGGLLHLSGRAVCLIPAATSPQLAIVFIAGVFLNLEFLTGFVVLPLLIFSVLALAISFAFTRYGWKWRVGSLIFSILIIPVVFTLYYLVFNQFLGYGVNAASFSRHRAEFEKAIAAITTAPIPENPVPKRPEDWKFEVVTRYGEKGYDNSSEPVIYYVMNVTPFGDTTLDFSLDRGIRTSGLYLRKASTTDTLIARAKQMLGELRVKSVGIQGNWVKLLMVTGDTGNYGYLYVREKQYGEMILAHNGATIEHIEGPWYSIYYP